MSGLSACFDCAPGLFQYSSGSSACYRCEPGSFSPSPSSTACDLCVPGDVQPFSGHTACAACPVGSYSWSDGSTSCKVCAHGTFQSTSRATLCYACTPGAFQSRGGSSSCESCALGLFSYAHGASACSACVAGRFQDVVGASVCRECTPGTFQPLESSTFCLLCPVGTYGALAGAEAETNCVLCPAGFYGVSQGSTAQEECAPCSAGSFSTALGLDRDDGCFACPVGTYAASGRGSCSGCPASTYCPGGGGFPLECADPGLFCNGTFLDAGPGRLPFCDGNRTWSMPCPTGTLCAQGMEGRKGLLPPWPARVHFVVMASGGSRRVDWPLVDSSDFADAVFWLEPQECDAGLFLLDDSCVPCANGTFGSARGGLFVDVCKPCPPGAYAAGVSGATTCTACDFGSFAGYHGMSTCSLCPPGRYQADLGGSVCLSCLPGSHSSESGSSACVLCPAGSVQAEEGASRCLQCNASLEYSADGDTVCLPCGITPDATNISGCEPAPAPDESEIWVSVRGAFKHDECLPAWNSTRDGVQVVRVNDGSPCVHELRVLGRPDLSDRYKSDVREEDNARSVGVPATFAVHPFNDTFYPDLCKQGQAFGVAHSGAAPFGASRIMIVTDTVQDSLLFESPCEGVWGVCTVSAFCPYVDVIVRVCVLDVAGDVLAEGNARLIAGVPRYCPPISSSSWVLSVEQREPGRPYFPDDSLHVSLTLHNGPEHLLAFRLVFVLHAALELALVNQSVPIRVESTGANRISLFGDMSSVGSFQVISLAEMDLRVRGLGSTVGLVSALRFERAEFLVGRSLWLSTQVLSSGFVCNSNNPDSNLLVLLDRRRATSIHARLEHSRLVYWRGLSRSAGEWGTRLASVLAVWNTGGPPEAVTPTACEAVTPSILLVDPACGSVLPKGRGRGLLLVTFEGVSTVLSVDVVAPEHASFEVLSSPLETRARVRVRAVLLGFQVDVARFVLGHDEMACADVRAVAATVVCPSPHGQHHGLPFLVSGKWMADGSFALNPSVLQASSDIVDVYLPATEEMFVSLDPTRASFLDNGQLRLVRSGGTPRCVVLKGISGQWSVRVVPPAPALISAELTHIALVVQQDRWTFIPRAARISHGLLCFSDGVCEDVSRDDRLRVSGTSDASLLTVSDGGKSVQTHVADGMCYVYFSFAGIPCVQGRSSVQIFAESVTNTFLECHECPPALSCFGDPLCLAWPSLFACGIPVRHFILRRILVDGSVHVSQVGSLVLTEAGRLSDDKENVLAVAPGTLRVSEPFAQNSVLIPVHRRWAVSVVLQCNEMPCRTEDVRLTKKGDPAALAPFRYPWTVRLSLCITLANGTEFVALSKLPSMRLLVDGVMTLDDPNAFEIEVKKLGPLDIRLAMDASWGLEDVRVVLHAHGLDSLHVQGVPSVFYQVHCTRVWEAINFRLVANLSNGVSADVLSSGKVWVAGSSFFLQSPACVSARFPGSGELFAHFGGITTSVKLSASLDSRLFKVIEFDPLPVLWSARINVDALVLGVRLAPFVNVPDPGLVLSKAVRWSASEDGIVGFRATNESVTTMILLSDYYKALSVSSILRGCQGSDPVVITRSFRVRVLTSAAGQVEFRSGDGLDYRSVPVGEELHVSVFMRAMSPLLSYTVRVFLVGVGKSRCLGGELPFSTCLVEPDRVGVLDVVFSGGYTESQRTGMVLVGKFRGVVQVAAVSKLQIFVEHAVFLDGSRVDSVTHEFAIELGKPGQSASPLFPVVRAVYEGQPKQYYSVDHDSWMDEPAAFGSMCGRFVVSSPGVNLPFPNWFRVDCLFLLHNDSHRALVSIMDPRVRVEYDRYLVRVDSEGRWFALHGAKGVTDIVCVYVQPSTLARSKTAITLQVVFAEVDRLILLPSVLTLKRMHCSLERFENGTVNASIALRHGGGLHPISVLSVGAGCPNVVMILSENPLLVTGRTLGSCKMRVSAFGAWASVDVQVTDSVLLLRQLVLHDPYVAHGGRGQAVALGLGGFFEDGSFLPDVLFLDPVLQFTAETPVKNLGNGIFVLLDNTHPSTDFGLVVNVEATCAKDSRMTAAVSVSFVVRLTPVLSHAQPVDLSIGRSDGGLLAMKLILLYPIAAFIVHLETDAEGISLCRPGPMFDSGVLSRSAMVRCAPNQPRPGSLVFAGVFSDEVAANGSVLLTLEPVPRLLTGTVEVSTGFGSFRVPVVAGRMGAKVSGKMPGLPVEDAASLHRRFRAGLMQPSLMPLAEHTMRVVMLQDVVVLDTVVYSNDNEVSLMVRLADRFLQPVETASVRFKVVASKTTVNSLNSPDFMVAKHVVDGWYAWEFIGPVLREDGVLLSYQVTTSFGSTEWAYMDDCRPCKLGRMLRQCPWMTSDRAVLRLVYRVHVARLPDDLPSFVSCIARVVKRRVLMHDGEEFTVDVESFIRARQVHEAVIEKMPFYLRANSSSDSAAVVDRVRVDYVNDTQDEAVPCPAGMYFTVNGTLERLPMHSRVGLDCYGMECFAGYVQHGHVCTPLSIPPDLGLVCLVVLMVLCFVISCVLCVLYLSRKQERAKAPDEVMDPESMPCDLMDARSSDDFLKTSYELDDYSSTLLDDEFSCIPINPSEVEARRA